MKLRAHSPLNRQGGLSSLTHNTWYSSGTCGLHTLCTTKHYCYHSYPRRPGTPPKLKPMVVDQYNKYMLGVDLLDQRMSYYQFVRKSVKWWRKVFFWMVEVVVVNAYIVYCRHTDARRKLSHKEFRRELVMSLCEEQRSTTAHRQPQ